MLLTMCLGGSINTFASVPPTNESIEISPRYKCIKTIDVNFSVSSTGKAKYSCNVETSNATKVKVSAKLQERTGTSWETIDTDSETVNQDYILYDGVSYVYNVSAEHRVEFTVTVTYDGGKNRNGN